MEDYLAIQEDVPNYHHFFNLSCNDYEVPSAGEYMTSLGVFGTIFVSIGTILTTATIGLALEACSRVIFQVETKFYRTNCMLVLSVYPVASTCSLVALAIPRAQLLTEAITQISLTISMYRLYLLLIDVGRRKVTGVPPMLLRVGPCCCWPCLPFPSLQFNEANLSWLQIIVMQFPIVQGLIYLIFLIMHSENPMIYGKYNVFLQPISISSILLALYGLNITFMSLKDINPELRLRLKAIVTQMVLLFSKLQLAIIRALPAIGLFPCNPPITPQIYANFTYNALMLIEMLLLCYAARHLYTEQRDEKADGTSTVPEEHRLKTELTNGNIVRQNNINNNNNNDNNNGRVQVPVGVANMGFQ
ncbi:organic solute transporter alpha-like protein 3 [Diachasma alloeum]|uniref:organic solute transporter alpha-like protein 3 n=1 Tax=Diachasma alloeum TaxID=454923 RepID=UPI000738354F|nr:organic solute transporter alpha-like protein 3 [Diachasma alloeum]